MNTKFFYSKLCLLLLFLILPQILACTSQRLKISQLYVASEHPIAIKGVDFDNNWVFDGEFSGGVALGSNVPPVEGAKIVLARDFFPEEAAIVWVDKKEKRTYLADLSNPNLGVLAKDMLKKNNISPENAQLVMVFLEKGEVNLWLRGPNSRGDSLNAKILEGRGFEGDAVNANDGYAF